ncbi:MAG: acyl-CoA/acyl-ACP dehydrogenase [Bdellovibrionales bacterium]|nr:acyl-CoA/acyl-ACP dehydrogenase [Ramlibacter sp.]
MDPTLIHATLHNAAALLARLRPCFDHGVTQLAQACSDQGKLSNTKLDAHQVLCFELAWASADLLAAETVTSGVTMHTSQVDARLALVFTADAIAAVLARLDGLYLDLKLDLAPLQSIAADPAWADLRREGAGAAALEAAGRAVAEAQGEVGYVALPENLVMAQDAFRRFAADVVAPQAEAIHRHDLTVPETLLAPLREMGVFGLSIPERFGGSAPDDRDDTLMMVTVTEALSEASLAAAGSLITRPEILSRALLSGGTEAQKQHWLPKIAAGDPLCAIAITEPDYGSDVAALSLKGTRVAGGWRLNGAKTWCTFAGKAGLLMVVTRTDPDKSAGYKGLSILLVEKPSTDAHEFNYEPEGGGRLRGKAIPTIGYRGMHSFDLSFEDFFVPDANVIGEAGGLGKGFYFTMAGMMGGRLQTAARACGVMRAALLASLQYSRDRKVFGSPLLAYPLTLAKLARMAARFSACRQLAYVIATLLDKGGGRMEASLVKLLACRSAELVTREALQLHGGMGYAEETPVSRYFVDARVLSIFEGAEETLALKVVARSLLEGALNGAANKRGTSS